MCINISKFYDSSNLIELNVNKSDSKEIRIKYQII